LYTAGSHGFLIREKRNRPHGPASTLVSAAARSSGKSSSPGITGSRPIMLCETNQGQKVACSRGRSKAMELSREGPGEGGEAGLVVEALRGAEPRAARQPLLVRLACSAWQHHNTRPRVSIRCSCGFAAQNSISDRRARRESERSEQRPPTSRLESKQARIPCSSALMTR
jgi:hypothetical protein